MKEQSKGSWPETGLIMAGGIVFLVGLIIILFKELDIPRYWIPAVVGIALLFAGGITGLVKRVF